MQRVAMFRPRSVRLFSPEPEREPLLPTGDYVGARPNRSALEGTSMSRERSVLTLNEIGTNATFISPPKKESGT